jgi:tight adherence protein B
MVELFAAVAMFVAVVSFALFMLLRVPGRRSVEQRIATLATAPTQGVDADGLLRRETGTFGFMRPVSNSSWADRAAIDLQRAGLGLKVSEYFLLRLLLGALLAVLAFLLISSSFWGLLFTVVLAFVGFMIPAWYASSLKGRRISAINAQLVEGLGLIANSLRSGFAFTQSVEMACKQLQSPLKDEFERFLQDIQLGAKQEEALLRMVSRTGSYDVEMMVTTILVQKTTGGNLSEILDNVAETIRERERLQGEIRSLTASQRLTGIILSIYPIFLFAIFTLIAYDLMSVLWTTEGGRVLLAVAAVLQVMGFITIRRILRLDV